MRYVADNGLSAFIDRHTLHTRRLLRLGAVPLQGFHLDGERTRELCHSPLRAVSGTRR